MCLYCTQKTLKKQESFAVKREKKTIISIPFNGHLEHDHAGFKALKPIDYTGDEYSYEALEREITKAFMAHHHALLKKRTLH